jgi:uncharacterized membrane protein YkvI
MTEHAPPKDARVSPDHPAVGVAAIFLVVIVMAAAMVFSFTALTAAAAWTHAPTWAHPLAAVFLDGAIVVYSISYAIFRWRGQDTKRTLAILIAFTIVSCTVNVIHAGAGWMWDLSKMEAWGGMLIAGAAPIAALLAAEEVTRLAFVQRPIAAAVPDPIAVKKAEPHEQASPAPATTAHSPVVTPHRRPTALLTFRKETTA